MLKRISTIDYYGTEFINLENNRILLDDNKFNKVLEIIRKITYYFGSNLTIEPLEKDIDSFIINLCIDEYQFEFYAEKVKNKNIMENTVQNIYKDGNLVVEGVHNRNYTNYDIVMDFHTKLNLLTKNIFCSGNIEKSLFTIKNKYDQEYFDVMNKLIPIFFDNLDYVDCNGVYTKSGHRFSLEDQGSGFNSFVNLIPSMCEAIKTNSTVIIDRYTSFHPILKRAIFKELWDEGYLHKLLKEDSSKGQIIMRSYMDES